MPRFSSKALQNLYKYEQKIFSTNIMIVNYMVPNFLEGGGVHPRPPTVILIVYQHMQANFTLHYDTSHGVPLR